MTTSETDIGIRFEDFRADARDAHVESITDLIASNVEYIDFEHYFPGYLNRWQNPDDAYRSYGIDLEKKHIRSFVVREEKLVIGALRLNFRAEVSATHGTDDEGTLRGVSIDYWLDHEQNEDVFAVEAIGAQILQKSKDELVHEGRENDPLIVTLKGIARDPRRGVVRNGMSMVGHPQQATIPTHDGVKTRETNDARWIFKL